MSSEATPDATPETLRKNLLRELDGLFDQPDTVAVPASLPECAQEHFIVAGKCAYTSPEDEKKICDVTISRFRDELYPGPWYTITCSDEDGADITTFDTQGELNDETAASDADELYLLGLTTFNKNVSMQAARTYLRTNHLRIVIPEIVELNLNTDYPDALIEFYPEDPSADRIATNWLLSLQ